MKQFSRSTCRNLLALCGLWLTPAVACGYAIGDGTGDHLAHQWITYQGWQLFQSQFGPSEIDAFLGDVTEYPGGMNTRVIEGAYDEDVPGENPWGESGGVDHPSLRHFWSHANDFSREFDNGILLFDSAANRAVKYFTGGRDLVGNLDPDWGTAQGATAEVGIPQLHLEEDRDRAYYWLGHVAHLVQDLSLPAHAHADAHLEGYGVFDDPDPVHDWVDGRDFSTSGNGSDGRPAAAFDDVDPHRYMRWRYDADLGGVGRAENPASVLTGDLRSASQLIDPEFNPSLLRPEVAASLEPLALPDVQPLYALALELASIADDFDSRHANGQADRGERRDGPGVLNFPGDYNDFTREELDEVADVIVPHAMRATAELIRYFYGEVDTTPPVIALAGDSPDVERPRRIALPDASELVLFSTEATASDPTSGVDLDGFRFVIERQEEGEFMSFVSSDPTTQSFATPLPAGLYRVTAGVDNGAGLFGTSSAGYVEILPELTADFDGDGDVDGHDLLDLLLGFGTTDADLADGDADGDGDVDREDLAFWKFEVGAMTGEPGLGPGATVPEPASIVLLVGVFAIAILLDGRRGFCARGLALGDCSRARRPVRA